MFWFWTLWKEASLLKKIYVFFAGVIALALAVLFVGLYWEIYLFAWTRTLPEKTTVQNLALAFLGTVSGLGALFGVYLAIRRTEEAQRQSVAAEEQNKTAKKEAETAEQGQITDRLNKATEGLGKSNQKGEPVIEVRLGALYALERIAEDSLRDHVQIVEILCAYVRTNSPIVQAKEIPKNPTEDTETYKLTEEYERKRLREDIQTALTIIGRRQNWPNRMQRMSAETEKQYRPNLRFCNLENATLTKANLNAAFLLEASLKGANLLGANLSDAWLSLTNLTGAMLRDANMLNTNMANAYAQKGDFSECKHLTQKQLDVMFCGQAVKIPSHLTRPEHWSKDDVTWEDFEKNHTKYLEQLWKKEYGTPYPAPYK